jgi:hypothetical protein
VLSATHLPSLLQWTTIATYVGDLITGNVNANANGMTAHKNTSFK